MMTPDQALDLAQAYLKGQGRPSGRHRVLTDTTNFFQVDVGDVLLFPKGAYLVLGHEREGRFGLEDEAKYWVKKGIDLETGQRKVIKLVFFERFERQVGHLSYECFRSPKKEAYILELVHGRPSFMQGTAVSDRAGNLVRIIDYVYGPTLDQLVADIDSSHEDYFHQTLPRLWDLIRPAFEGISFLHRHRIKHGDIRRDHLIHSRSGDLVWIDFDYNYRHGEHLGGLDLLGLGNILCYVAGGGDHTLPRLRRDRPDVADALTPGDVNIVFHNRLVNLKKLFPYIPDRLNRILMHFSLGSDVFYESADELLDDMDQARKEWP